MLNKKHIFIITLALALFLPFLGADSASQSTVKASDATDAKTTDFLGWAQWFYPFGLSAAAVLAVLMIVIAGFEMITFSWNPDRLKSAKGKIWSAVGGLLLAVLSYLILRTINPELVKFKLEVPKVGTQKEVKEVKIKTCTPECKIGEICVEGACKQL